MNGDEGALAGIISDMLNGALRLDPDCEEHLRPLVGSRLLVMLCADRETLNGQAARCVFLRFRVAEEVQRSFEEEADQPAARVRVTAVIAVRDDEDFEPDIVIRVAVPDLVRHWAAGERRGPAPAGMEIKGEAEKLRCLREAMSRFDPDVEELLSGYVGDFAARRLSFFADQNWWRDQQRRFLDRFRRYLVEETRLAPDADELQRFTREINRLYDRCEHLRVRLRNLQQKAQ